MANVSINFRLWNYLSFYLANFAYGPLGLLRRSSRAFSISTLSLVNSLSMSSFSSSSLELEKFPFNVIKLYKRSNGYLKLEHFKGQIYDKGKNSAEKVPETLQSIEFSEFFFHISKIARFLDENVPQPS